MSRRLAAKVNEMSDRLAISAAFSVLMMSAFVLFGSGSTRADFGPDVLQASPGNAAPASLVAPGNALLPFN